jgi:hydroxypyruvate isomerase
VRLSVCLEMVYTDKPFLQRIALAGRAGYRNAEMWFIDGTFNGKDCSGDPKDPARVKKAAADAGIALTNAVIGSPDGALGGGLTDPSKRKTWLARAAQTFKFCKAAGIEAVIVCTGNVIKGKNHKAMRDSVVDGLKATAKEAEKAGITMYLEPLNDTIDHAGYFLTSSDEAAQICRDVGSPRMKLVFDCYHMQIMEGDLTGHIKKNLDVIGHMHAAGHPGRHELWLGETNYAYLVRAIGHMGYKGAFCLEYTPTMDSTESLLRTKKYLGA